MSGTVGDNTARASGVIAGASADFVRVATNTLGSATTTWTLDSIFSATYDQYMVLINLRTDESSNNIYMRFLDNSGSELTSSWYRGFNGGGEALSGSANNTQQKYRWNESSFQLTGAGDSWSSYGTPDAVGYQATMYFYKPNEATAFGARKSFYGHHWWNSGADGRVMTGYIGGYYNASDIQSRGLSLYSSETDGLGADSNVVVYGLKHA
jgi:hypothetical protein